MNEISLPYHLIIPSIISILVLGILFFKRKSLFKTRKWKWFWISLTIFLLFYLLIVGGATYGSISSKLTYLEFDLNGDGNFSDNEITPEQIRVENNLISDTGRNLSVITGLFFSGILAFFVFIIGKITEYIKKKKSKTILFI